MSELATNSIQSITIDLQDFDYFLVGGNFGSAFWGC